VKIYNIIQSNTAVSITN